MNKVLSFTGFTSPNTTPVPDQLFDELLTVLSGNELKVLLYIIRRTFGFKKQRDHISLNQMLRGIQRKDGKALDGGVGLSKPTLLNALQTLLQKGIILREQRSSQARGHLPSAYGLKLTEQMPDTAKAASVAQHPLGQKSLPRVGKEPLPTTRNSNTRKSNNVVKKRKENRGTVKPREQVDYLIEAMEQQTDDHHSRGNFAQLAASLPDALVFQLLAEMRQAPRVRNRGAWLTARAKSLIHTRLKQEVICPLITSERVERVPDRKTTTLLEATPIRPAFPLPRQSADDQLSSNRWMPIGALLRDRLNSKKPDTQGYREYKSDSDG